MTDNKGLNAAAVTDLGVARARRTSDPSCIAPRDMLLRVIDQIDRGFLNPSHVMVISATTDDGMETESLVDYAGSYDRFGQIGMLADAMRVMGTA